MKKQLILLLIIVCSTIVYGSKAAVHTGHPGHHLKKKAYHYATGDGQIPIIAWIGVTEHGQLDRYQELKEAGFTESYWPFSSANAVESAMSVAQKAGIKLFVSCPEFARDPEKIAARFMNNPGNAGYFINDEPPTSRFPGLTSLIKRIKAVDNNHICYVNLLPNIATGRQLGATDYQDYLNTYINQVPFDILSFDHYPIIGSTPGAITQNWYQNLELISEASKKYNKPFWAFALSVAFTPHPVATLGSLRLQVFSDLAYGAQAIQYFTYWTPAVTAGGPNFDNAIISRDGKQTEVYATVKQVNNEIKILSGVFLGSKIISVTHMGNRIPVGTKPLTKLPRPVSVLKTNGSAVVSILQNNGRNYLVIVNGDFTSPMDLTVKFNSGVNKISNDDGTATIQNSNESTVRIEPGNVSIYSWPDSLN